MSGDPKADLTFQPVPPNTTPPKIYMPFKLGALGITTATPKKVLYIQDPFGNSYGYSSTAARTEADYKQTILSPQTPIDPSSTSAQASTPPSRGATSYGYNPTYDLWSTGGSITTGIPSASVHARWIKNW